MKERTKIMFAEQLEKMLKTIPFDKIRIVDLCKRCDAVPQTFYYHFDDKYDLTAWMFLYDLSEVLGQNKEDYSSKYINKIFKQMEKRKAFYQETFKISDYNAISNYIHRLNIKLSLITLKYLYDKNEITPEQLLEIKYHSYGVIGIFKEWLYGDSSASLKELSKFLYSKTPKYINEAFSNYPFTRKEILQKAGKYKLNSEEIHNKYIQIEVC